MSLFKSIATFGGWTLISRITGFFRDMVMANYLGAGAVSDAFFVAFKLPNLFRSLFAEGAFTSAFVPIFSQKLVGGGKAQAIKFAVGGDFGAGVQPRAFCVADGNRYALGGGGFGAGVCR